MIKKYINILTKKFLIEKYGYFALIVWEQEFRDLDKLKDKLKVFNNG